RRSRLTQRPNAIRKRRCRHGAAASRVSVWLRLTRQSIAGEGRSRMRAAAVQLNSNEDKERNLASADELTRAAAAEGAELVVLPEKFNVLGTHEHYVEGAETLDGP